MADLRFRYDSFYLEFARAYNFGFRFSVLSFMSPCPTGTKPYQGFAPAADSCGHCDFLVVFLVARGLDHVGLLALCCLGLWSGCLMVMCHGSWVGGVLLVHGYWPKVHVSLCQRRDVSFCRRRDGRAQKAPKIRAKMTKNH